LEGYLNALIRNNTDLEPGGIKQTKVRVVLPLDSIYVGLQADCDRRDVDRRVMQEELDEIKKNLEGEEDSKEREKQYQIWAHHSRVIQQALEISGPREDLANIVQRHRHVVILGDPGSGKTTLVRYLTLRLARAITGEPERIFQPQEFWDEKNAWRLPDLGPVRVPILLRISHYAEARQKDPDLALVDYLPRYFAGLSVPHADELGPLLQRLLDAGRCMVLLDGLDEIIDPIDRRNIAATIGQFAGVYRETGLPDWLAHSLTFVPRRAEEKAEAQAESKNEHADIIIQWDKNVPEDVRLTWGKQIRQRRTRGRAVRLAWELLGEARYAHVGNRFVVTSRIAGYHFAGVSGEFEHYTIRRMSLDDIKLFLEKWCPAVERRIAEASDPVPKWNNAPSARKTAS
jgi:predicted NACHT family NTPase